MKKISFFAILMILGTNTIANASNYTDKKFKNEISAGLDVLVAPTLVDTIPEDAPGELGFAVYEYAGAVSDTNTKVFIPTSMYVRMGGGMNLGFATDSAEYFGTKHNTKNSYTAQLGLGWNLSSYVRTEIDFQTATLKFNDVPDTRATYNTIGGTLYFDFARRYIQSGDITHRRTFVPYMGLGAAIGTYEFQGTDGADGMVIAAPRATLGFNIMFNDLIGIDIAYQYQMMIGNGFGWGASNGGVNNISNLMTTIRANF
ncbi:MAG: hypothetical protein UIC65_03150 [Alphaproteobacteria bacterium]|nr:hypothetical protein [Alphaproteobacteria bacterium]